MEGLKVWRQVSLYGLAGFGAFCFTFILVIQWSGNPLIHEMRSILKAECSLETTNEIEEVDLLIEIKRVVDENRKIMRDEMKGYQYPDGKYNISARKLEDLAIEEHGTPIRSIILTTWRSGSTFLGDIIGEHPGNFYHYEPLSDFRANKLRGPPLVTEALIRIRELFNCEYANVQDTLIKHARIFPYMLNQTSYAWNQCARAGVCFDHRYLSASCKLFPLQSMKLLRLRLHDARKLLDDEKLSARMVLLVRDPRGTVKSRKRVNFCQMGPDCSETALLCADLVSDYKAAVEASRKYPDTFRVIRYEDLTADPYKQVEELSKFYGREFHPKIRKFLDTHTTTDIGGPFHTFRNSKTTPYRWKTELDFEEVKEIQRTCATAMEYWGYVPAMNATHQREFNPVRNYDLSL